MDPFASSYLAELTAALSAQILAAAGRRMREALSGSEEEQAVGRCVQAGVVALLATAGGEEPEAQDLLAEIFCGFFRDPDVGRELATILRGTSPDGEELAFLFAEAGYDATTLPGLDFQQGMAAFEAAFLAVAAEEPALRGLIQTEQLLAQTRLQRDMLDTLRELAAFLRQARPGSVGIGAEQITAENVVSGVQIVYQMPRLEVSAATPDWEEHYLRTLISRCDPLDLAPIDPAHPVDAQPVHISDVFTTLYLEGKVRAADESVSDALLGRPMERRDETEYVPVQALEAVAALPRLAILGQPGGGKSTLVNHLATQLARRRLGQAVDSERLPGWPEGETPLPVRIVLRRFAAWLPEGTRRGEAGLVWGYLEELMQQWGCRQACDGLERALLHEGGIVFFDGLDEVRQTDAEAKRSIIKEAIAAFAAPLEECKVVVTCREYAYKQGDAWRLPEAAFPVVELALFNLDQVAAFTRTWYRVVGPQKGWDEQKCGAEALNLYNAARAWPHLRELAQYPLLLTLMSQVHGRDGSLPQDRADLYERSVDLLLAHWENRIVRDVDGEQEVLPGLVMQLGIRTLTLRAALERVAFDAHERQEQEQDRGERAADIPREDLRDALEADLGSVDQADAVIAYVQERAGLLQARDNRTYAFPHRTFQEYLAATYLLRQGEFDTMLRDRVRRDQSWWQEAFLLAAGASRDTPRNISDLVDCLLPMGPEGDTGSPEKAREARLAAQALYETDFSQQVEREAEPGRFTATHRRVVNWLLASLRDEQNLSAQERADCGDALAQLGDPRPGVGLRPDDLPDMAWCPVPAGPFLMGSDRARDEEALQNEMPQHEVTLRPYAIGKYPVTNAQYEAFVKAGGYGERRYWTDVGWERKGERTEPDTRGGVFDLVNHPVVRVTWYEAVAFCRWLTERLLQAGELQPGQEVRLPTEAEWEKAARGSDGRIFPWADDFEATRCNSLELALGSTTTVGVFPAGAGPCEAEDLSGNVWEWTQSLLQEYPYDAEEGREEIDDNGPRVLRGGSFLYNRRRVRCAYRFSYFPFYRLNNIGFRCVVAPVASGL